MNPSAKAIHRALLAWYKRNARSLPWRRSRDPYSIWLSEIMLQQTRVEAVIPYFEKFLGRYPDVAALARADLDELRGLWAGLGYYSRVVNLKRAAEAIIRDHHGIFPCKPESLRSLPGIGPYTSAAIASIAFGENIAAVDGNLERVFSRILALEKIAKGAREILDFAQDVAARGEAGGVNQALMDLGSGICLPRAPRCEACPLSSECRAFNLGRPTDFPRRPEKKLKLELNARAYLIFSAHKQDSLAKILVARRPKGAWLAGQWDIPWWIEGRDENPGSGQIPISGDVRVKRVITHHKIKFRVDYGFVNTESSAARAEASLRQLSSEIRWLPFAELDSLPRPTRTAISKVTSRIQEADQFAEKRAN